MKTEIKKGYKQTEAGVIPEDWEVKDIEKITISVSSGKSKTKNEIGDFPIYGSTGIIGYKNKPDYSGYRILIARVGANAGFINKVNGQYCVSDNTLIVTYKEGIDFKFSFYQLVNYRLNKLVFGSGQPLITGSQIKEIKIPIPPKSEQTAIAQVLSDTDELIASHEKLIAKKRAIKQGAMQELLTSKKRLPGFSGKWEVKKLGEIGQCLRGVSYNGDRDLFEFDNENSIRLLRSNNIQNNVANIYDIQFVNNDKVKSNQILNANDILICMANGSKQLVGKSAIIRINDNKKYTFGAFMGCFRTNPNFADKEFVSYLFHSNLYRYNIDILLSGSSINNLKPSDIESIIFNFPKMDEQTAIAAVLSDMDSEIDALEKKLDKYKQIKQGMMQELLTGKTRLI